MSRPLIVFADDWGRHPSSCQHLVRHLLPTRPVVWVNTIGTRPPRLDLGTVRRAAGKLREWAKPEASGGRKPAEGTLPGSRPVVAAGGVPSAGLRPPLASIRPTVLAPKMWPSFASPLARRLNRTLLTRALAPVFAAHPNPTVVTTLPLVADLPPHLPPARWVYYCVDDFSVWPGYDGATMQRMERDLVPHLSAAVAVSDTLVKHLATLGVSAHLLTHGVDLAHWQTAPTDPPPEFAGLEPPVVLFWGVIDRRLDLAFVRHLGEHLSRGTLLFVGPQEDTDPALFAVPRVAVRPAVPFARLPQLAAHAGVLVMPYADAPVTRAMQPLKLKEYLATGRPAVVRDLPSTRPWADACDVADTPAAFTAAVLARLADGLPESQRVARRRLTAEGWAAKADEFEGWVNPSEKSAHAAERDV